MSTSTNWYWFRWKILILILTLMYQEASGDGGKLDLGSTKKPSVAQSCSKIAQFAQSISSFAYCSITTSESNLCRKCQDEMTGIYDNYFSINTMIPESFNESPICPKESITPKKLSEIRDYFKHTESIWLNGNCDTCYEVETPNEESSSLGRKHNLQVFDDLVTSFAACVDLHPNSTCNECVDTYTKLNSFYDQLAIKFNGNLCFEISVTMANARSRWSDDLHCSVLVRSDYVVAIIAGTVIIVSVLLYFIGRSFMRALKPSLMIPKRQSMVNVRSLEEDVSETTPIIQASR